MNRHQTKCRLAALLLGLAALWAGPGVATTQAADGLVVYFHDAGREPVRCQLASQLPIVRFTADGLTIDDTVSGYALLADADYDAVARIAFVDVADDEVSDIDAPRVDVVPTLQPTFRFMPGDDVAVDGVTADARVTLVSLDGKRQPVDVETTGDRSIVVHLGHLPRGVYLLQVGAQTYKLMKK